MTAIVGLVEGDTVWMGGDSAGVGGYSLSTREDPKVFINGEFLIGYTTSFRMGQILEHEFAPPVPHENENGMRYMVKRFIPAVISTMEKAGAIATDKGVKTCGTFLAGYRGQLYMIGDDFQVAKMLQNFSAVGCGQELAVGSLFSTQKTKMSPRERIEIALKAAESFSAGVRGPFTILSKRHR